MPTARTNGRESYRACSSGPASVFWPGTGGGRRKPGSIPSRSDGTRVRGAQNTPPVTEAGNDIALITRGNDTVWADVFNGNDGVDFDDIVTLFEEG